MYIAAYIIDLVTLFYLIGSLNASTALNESRKKPFLLAIILTIVIILAEVGTVLANYENLDFRGINILCHVLWFGLAPMIPIAITLIFGSRILKSHKFLLIPTLINLIATVLSPIFRFIFYVNESNKYVRGDYFFIFIIVYIVNLIILAFLTLEVGKKNNYPIVSRLVFLSLFTIIGTSIQLMYPLAYSFWHCATLSLLLYFLLISEFDSSFDILTGLYNRAAFEKAIRRIGGIKAFSLIIIDMNDFKEVNDTYGHDYGDAAIKEVAGIIRKSFNKKYNCYRVGGDEFYIIGKETEKEKIKKQLKLMTSNIIKAREKGSHLPTVSYGYSIFIGEEKLDFNKIFREADSQMYYYKRLHKANADRGTIGTI